jgi:DNA-directed RNA polymerase subunit RPC12/RpoP
VIADLELAVVNVTFACPRCEKPALVELAAAGKGLICPHCNTSIAISAATVADGKLDRCLVCPGRDLYLRKDFPQRLGVLIVVLGFVASSITWAYSRPIGTYAILFATALVDVVLYLVMPSALVCYHCGAQYRGLSNLDRYSGFDLDMHERHRQQKIRAAELQRSREKVVATAVSSSENGDSSERGDSSARG